MSTIFDNHRSLADEVALYLRREFLFPNAYPKGVYIREEELAQRLNISRGPIREAMKLLEGQGLIKTIPRKGSIVVDFAPEEIEELLNIRSALEIQVYEAIISGGLFSADDNERLEAKLQEIGHLIATESSRVDLAIKIREMDMDFHIEVAKLSKCKWTVDFLQKIYALLNQAMARELLMDDRLFNFLDNHRKILEWLRQGNIEELRKRTYPKFHSSLKKNAAKS